MGRWGWKRNYANKLIGAAKLIEALGTIVPKPLTESQVRPLTALPPERRAEAWKEAVETAPEGRVTGKHVKQTVERIAGSIEPTECDVMMARHYATMAINQLKKINRKDPSVHSEVNREQVSPPR